MARKEIIVTIADRGRDLTFKIREMPATRLERWLLRSLLLLVGSAAAAPNGIDVEKGIAWLSENALTALGNLDYEEAAPLLDELLACCSRVDAGIEQQMTPDVADGIIEDVRTLFRLREEALKVNLGFFGDGGLFGSPAHGTPPRPDSSATPTSPR